MSYFNVVLFTVYGDFESLACKKVTMTWYSLRFTDTDHKLYLSNVRNLAQEVPRIMWMTNSIKFNRFWILQLQQLYAHRLI